MECKVVFVDQKLKSNFESLKDSDPRLYKEINRALVEVSKNVFFGRAVKKDLIPKNFIKKYKIDNLWIYNLRKDWRLLYSVGKDEVEIIAVVLDWMSHKDYENLFSFS